jgi:hypothetical protein
LKSLISNLVVGDDFSAPLVRLSKMQEEKHLEKSILDIRSSLPLLL